MPYVQRYVPNPKWLPICGTYYFYESDESKPPQEGDRRVQTCNATSEFAFENYENGMKVVYYCCGDHLVGLLRSYTR